MLSFERAAELLDQMAEEFPPEFFADLNGGISLLPRAKRDRSAPGRLYIMGEFCHDQMGRYILIYYGSFEAVCADYTDEELEDELFYVLTHELTHHIESLAGENKLEIKDAQRMADYLDSFFKEDEEDP